MKRLDELKSMLHKDGLAIIDYNGKKIPCILMANERFENIMKNYHNKSVMVDSRLDIWHDDKGDVYVNIVLDFENYEEVQALLYANETLPFFEALAESGIIALMPISYNSNILMIQLAKREKMEEALESIKGYMMG